LTKLVFLTVRDTGFSCGVTEAFTLLRCCAEWRDSRMPTLRYML